MADEERFCRLDSLADVRQPIMFGKRAMIGSETKGIAVYSSSEMLMLNPEPAFYLSRRFELKVNTLLQVKRGWVLISRTGSIGYTLYVSRERDGWIVDDHMIRVIPHDERLGALLYAYLSSPPGQAALHSLAYGAVQLVIKDIQVTAIQIPVPTESALDGIAGRIESASSNRTRAAELLSAANVGVHKINGLPVLRDNRNVVPGKECHAGCFPVTACQVSETPSAMFEYRLDAHFYNKTAQLTVANIRKCQSEVETLGDVTERVFFCNRFTRTFVDQDHGIPYLAGKNIVQIRPTDLAYLSRSQTNDLDQYRLHKGWILMTCSGTIGRTCLVWKNFEEFVGTHDLIRIVPDSSKIDGGYLYAFLSSEYGKQQVLRYRHGSVIDHVTPEQVQRVLIPLPSRKGQTGIGDKVREAYDKRAEAIRLEDEAQEILMKELTNVLASKGV